MILFTTVLCLLFSVANGFQAIPAQIAGTPSVVSSSIDDGSRDQSLQPHSTRLMASTQDESTRSIPNTLSRRTTFKLVIGTLMVGSTPSVALAAERVPLNQCLYRILRVREATMQEARLIKNGTFKDVQRNNVKLAIRFMIENYRLNDAFVAASSYLASDTKVPAAEIGQSAVSNLYTILEYFDSGDVENIKVTSLGGKEELVLKGLDATKRKIDDFVAYFPKSTVDEVATLITEENKLNEKEFDPEIGQILNMPKV